MAKGVNIKVGSDTKQAEKGIDILNASLKTLSKRLSFAIKAWRIAHTAKASGEELCQSIKEAARNNPYFDAESTQHIIECAHGNVFILQCIAESIRKGMSIDEAADSVCAKASLRRKRYNHLRSILRCLRLHR